MAHKFNPDRKHKLDTTQRRKELPPEPILKELMLEVGDNVADIGCGIGYFTIPAAKIVGEEGKVYAIDTEEEMLAEVEKRFKKEKLTNIELVNAGEYKSNIKQDVIDFMFLVNVLHEIEDKDKFFNNYLSKLKTQGKLAVIEFKKIATESGPPLEERISQEELAQLFTQHNLKIAERIDLNSKQYALVGIKD